MKLRFKYERSNTCVICGRRKTLLIQWAADPRYYRDSKRTWSCWRPSHARKAVQSADMNARLDLS